MRVAGRQLSIVTLQLLDLLAQLLCRLLSILQPCLQAALCSEQDSRQAMAIPVRIAS